VLGQMSIKPFILCAGEIETSIIRSVRSKHLISPCVRYKSRSSRFSLSTPVQASSIGFEQELADGFFVTPAAPCRDLRGKFDGPIRSGGKPTIDIDHLPGHEGGSL